MVRVISGQDTGREPTAITNGEAGVSGPLANHGRGSVRRHVWSLTLRSPCMRGESRRALARRESGSRDRGVTHGFP